MMSLAPLHEIFLFISLPQLLISHDVAQTPDSYVGLSMLSLSLFPVYSKAKGCRNLTVHSPSIKQPPVDEESIGSLVSSQLWRG